MKLLLLLVLCCLSLHSGEATRKSYRGYQIIQFTPLTEEHVEYGKSLEEDFELDVWLQTGVVGMPVDILVPPHKVPVFKRNLVEQGMSFTVIDKDIQVGLDETWERLDARRAAGEFAYDWNDYNDYDTVMEEVNNLAADCHADVVCEIRTIGDSYEGRDMKVLSMRHSGNDAAGPTFWFDATIHAREWLSTATLMKILDHMVRDYATDGQVQNLVQTYNFHFLPVVNPDGYTWTWTNTRLWRKSRMPNGGSSCIGTDLNRNYDYQHGGSGASSNPCSETYHGGSPASNPEVQNMQNEIMRLAGAADMKGLLNVHTYGQLWLFPYAHTVSGSCQQTDDHEDLTRVANAAANAIEDTHNTNWSPGTWCTVLYASSGVEQEYAYAVGGIKYSFTPELRGGRFDPPASAIQPSYEEIWNGVVAMANAIE